MNDLPIDWESHPDRDKWGVLEAPNGQRVIYHMSARTYRLERNVGTISASPSQMYVEVFLDRHVATVPFGKYHGHPVYSVAEDDPGYAEWMLSVARRDWLREALERELEKVRE